MCSEELAAPGDRRLTYGLFFRFFGFYYAASADSWVTWSG